MLYRAPSLIVGFFFQMYFSVLTQCLFGINSKYKSSPSPACSVKLWHYILRFCQFKIQAEVLLALACYCKCKMLKW